MLPKIILKTLTPIEPAGLNSKPFILCETPFKIDLVLRVPACIFTLSRYSGRGQGEGSF